MPGAHTRVPPTKLDLRFKYAVVSAPRWVRSFEGWGGVEFVQCEQAVAIQYDAFYSNVTNSDGNFAC